MNGGQLEHVSDFKTRAQFCNKVVIGGGEIGVGAIIHHVDLFVPIVIYGNETCHALGCSDE